LAANAAQSAAAADIADRLLPRWDEPGGAVPRRSGTGPTASRSTSISGWRIKPGIPARQRDLVESQGPVRESAYESLRPWFGRSSAGLEDDPGWGGAIAVSVYLEERRGKHAGD
jgi:hypothetical protein